jgi:hypothetical protein
MLARMNTGSSRHGEQWFFAGVISALIYYSQPLWLIGMSPIILYVALGRKNTSRYFHIFLFLSGALLSVLIMYFAVLRDLSFVFVRPISWKLNPIAVLASFPGRLSEVFSGAYDLREYKFGVFPGISGAAWSVLFFPVLISQIARAIKDKSLTPGAVFTCSIIGIVLFSQFVHSSLYAHRYLLPLTGFFVVLASNEISICLSEGPNIKTAAQIMLSALIITGVFALWEFKDMPANITIFRNSRPHEAKYVRQLVKELVSHGVHYAYCNGPLLQWAIIYYSEEKVLCRYIFPRDRYPGYSLAVDEAFYANKPVAIVNEPTGPETGSNEPARYEILFNPTLSDIKNIPYIRILLE